MNNKCRFSINQYENCQSYDLVKKGVKHRGQRVFDVITPVFISIIHIGKLGVSILIQFIIYIQLINPLHLVIKIKWLLRHKESNNY